MLRKIVTALSSANTGLMVEPLALCADSLKARPIAQPMLTASCAVERPGEVNNRPTGMLSR